MICWPRKCVMKFQPTFYLSGVLLPIVNCYEYLGYTICNDQQDNDEMMKRVRKLYGTGNMIISKFKNCPDEVKTMIFRTYFSNIYCCPLWSGYNVGTFARLKVAHNDIFRSLLNQRRDASASQLFVSHNVKNLNSMIRTSMCSFL